MRHALARAAAAALLVTGLVAGAQAQMQTPPASTAPNGARLPPGPPGVPAKPGDPLPPPSDLTPNATPRYAAMPAADTPPGAPPAAPPATSQEGGARAHTPAHDGRATDHRAHRGAAARADSSTFPRGLRECADKVDRDERASCAAELYESNAPATK